MCPFGFEKIDSERLSWIKANKLQVKIYILTERMMPGASVRNSAHGKGHEEGGFGIRKGGSSLRKPPVPEHLPPKPESTYFTVSCSHLYLWLYGELTPLPLLEKELTYSSKSIKIPGCDKSVSTYKLLWRLSSLPVQVRPLVIIYSLPTMRGMRCFRLTKGRFFWEVRNYWYSGLVRNYIGEGFFICCANNC